MNLIDTQIEELEAKIQTFVENRESDGARSVDRLSYDRSPDAAEMRKSGLKYAAAYYRSIEAYKKFKRQNGGRGPGGEGRDDVDALDAASWREFLPARCRRPELKSQEAYDLEAEAGDIDWAVTAETNTVEVATPDCEPLTLAGENGQNVTNDPNFGDGASATQQSEIIGVASDSDAVLGLDKVQPEEREVGAPDGAMRTTGEPEPPSPPAVEALALGTSEADGVLAERCSDVAGAALIGGSMDTGTSLTRNASTSTSRNANTSTSTSTSRINEIGTEVIAAGEGDGTTVSVSRRGSEVGVVDESDMTGDERFEDSS